MNKYEDLFYIFPTYVCYAILSYLHEDDLYDDNLDGMIEEWVEIPKNEYNRLRHNRKYKPFLHNVRRK